MHYIQSPPCSKLSDSMPAEKGMVRADRAQLWVFRVSEHIGNEHTYKNLMMENIEKSDTLHMECSEQTGPNSRRLKYEHTLGMHMHRKIW